MCESTDHSTVMLLTPAEVVLLMLTGGPGKRHTNIDAVCTLFVVCVCLCECVCEMCGRRGMGGVRR